MTIQSLLRQLAVVVLAGTVGWSVSAGAADGLYSADSLMGSPVHDSDGERVGTVDDLLLGDTMEVHSLVVELDNVVGLGGREVVAERGTFTVETSSDESTFREIAYEVHLTVSADGLGELPEYDEGWWNRTTEGLAQAWENTREGSRTAWQRAREAGSSAWDAIREGARSLGERLQDAVDDEPGAEESTEGQP